MKTPRSKSYLIPLRPMGWSRARLTKDGRFYDSQVKEKAIVGIYMRNQHGTDPLFSAAITLQMDFYYKRPQTVNKADIYCPRAPDLDNLEKFLLDAMKNVLLEDDRIVVSIASRKLWTDDQPRTEFTITEV